MDFQIDTIDYKAKDARKKLVNSLHHTGFAILHNHPIEIQTILSVYSEWEKFFNSDEKYSYTFNPKTQDGYFPYMSENAKDYAIKDLKEFFHYYEWGIFPDKMSGNTISLYHDLLRVGEELLNWIDNSSPTTVSSNFSIPLYQMLNNSKANLLRVIHYPPITSEVEKGAVRAASHEDINLITILVTGSQPGLQVKTKNDLWVDVDCNPGWLVINTGDMLSECSKGYFPSTSHRVINPAGNKKNVSRYTMPLFIHPDDEVVLSKKYTAKSFLEERLREIGLKE